MGNFFKDLRKCYLSLEKTQKNEFVERGKNIISILSHQPLKDIKAVNKKESFIEKNFQTLPEAGFRIHLRDKKRKFTDPFTGKKESFFLEIIFNGEEIILRWPMGHKIFDFEKKGEKEIYKELDMFLRHLFTYDSPEKEDLITCAFPVNWF